MEEYELLKKVFIDKEKENIQLKEELNMLKSKLGGGASLLNINVNDLSAVTSTHDGVKGNILHPNDMNNLPEEDISNDHSYLSNLNLNNFFANTFRRESRNIKDTEDDRGFDSQQVSMTKDRSKSDNNRDPKSKTSLIHVNSSRDVLSTSNIDTPARNLHTQQTTKDSKNVCLDFGRLFEERSKSSNNILSLNKNVIKNIESNVKNIIKIFLDC
jgi:hypothetical protein